MANILFCRKCGGTFSKKGEGSASCPDCGKEMIDTGMPAETWRAMDPEQKEETRRKWRQTYAPLDPAASSAPEQKDSSVGGAGPVLKTLAVVLFILCVIDFIAFCALGFGFATALIVLVAGGLGCLLLYAVGEICVTLRQIRDRLDRSGR